MYLYGPSRGAHADYRGSRRDCDSHPMLILRVLRTGALIAAELVELSPCGVGLLPLRLRDSTRKAPSRYDARTSHAGFENASVVSDEWH